MVTNAPVRRDAVDADPPNRWRLIVDPAFVRSDAVSAQTLALGLYFKAMPFLLGNDGPYEARRVTLDFPDPKQQVLGPVAIPGLLVGHALRFSAARRMLGDNAVRVRWFQDNPNQRYWTTLYLPYR